VPLKNGKKTERDVLQQGESASWPAPTQGVRNKFSEELKQTILDAMHNANDEDLFGFVRDTACDTPTAGLALPC
jgi:hypothetical protein